MVDLKFLEGFVAKQQALLYAVKSQSPTPLEVHRLRDSVPKVVEAAGQEWSAQVHGSGVRFLGRKTQEVVDVHVGVADGEDLIDAWRLSEYLRSLTGKQSDHRAIERCMQEMAAAGILEVSRSYSGHYRICSRNAQ